MKDNLVAFIVDASLEKGSNGKFSKIIAFETQSMQSSEFNRGKFDLNTAIKKSFEDKFPNCYYYINLREGKIIQSSKDKFDSSWPSLLSAKAHDLSKKQFYEIMHDKYTHTYTPSYEAELVFFNNKINQRLYLPDQVSPEYRFFQKNKPGHEITTEIQEYFSEKKINKIVIKAANSYNGTGNFFINDITNKQNLEKGIKNVRNFDCEEEDYFIVEEQKTFPRISRKTQKEKEGYLTYRMLVFANKDGEFAHFIATKAYSKHIDSHRCELMKPCMSDKYYGKGDNFIDIDPKLMNKICKNIYQLYTDIKGMTKREFFVHREKLIAHKNSLMTRDKKINQFTIELIPRSELVNKQLDKIAWRRATEGYEFLANKIFNSLPSALQEEAKVEKKWRKIHDQIITQDYNLNFVSGKRNLFFSHSSACSTELSLCDEETYEYSSALLNDFAKVVEKNTFFGSVIKANKIEHPNTFPSKYIEVDETDKNNIFYSDSIFSLPSANTLNKNYSSSEEALEKDHAQLSACKL